MKLIVAGATGFVASEVIRQAVRMPEITSIIALARKPITADTPESSKIKNFVIKDYGEYPEEVKKELAGADACIW
jgi:nucleoside-diphosphate-sugar epimerase